MFVLDKADLVDFMTAYFSERRHTGFTAIRHEVRDLTSLSNGGVKADLTWHFEGEAGAARQSVDVTCYCSSQEGNWKIALVDVTTPPSDTFRAVRGT